MLLLLSASMSAQLNLLACIQDLLFYQLPEHASFYSELVNFLEEGSAGTDSDGHATVTILFDKFDSLQMQRIVGKARCSKMMKSSSSTFMYC